jgi:hypothetical protein
MKHTPSRPNVASSVGLCGAVSVRTRAERIVEPACRTGTEVTAGGLVLVVTVLSGGTLEVRTDEEDAVVFGGWTLA